MSKDKTVYGKFTKPKSTGARISFDNMKEIKPEPVDKVDTLEEAARIEGVKYIRSLGGSEYSIGSMNDHAVFIAGFKHGASYSEAIVLKALKLAIEIINDVDRYQGSNLVNGEIEKFKEIIQSLKK